MTALAPTLQAFFTDRLIRQRHASPQTVAAYRDTWRLLLAFTAARVGKQPIQLDIGDLNAPLIGDFLDHLERDRGNSPRTRNARLARTLSRYEVPIEACGSICFLACNKATHGMATAAAQPPLNQPGAAYALGMPHRAVKSVLDGVGVSTAKALELTGLPVNLRIRRTLRVDSSVVGPGVPMSGYSKLLRARRIRLKYADGRAELGDDGVLDGGVATPAGCV